MSLCELRLLLDPAARPAIADANQLELAILNLAINACDAMPEGLTGGIAHDFNNLLTAVAGNLELLLEGGSQLELDGR